MIAVAVAKHLDAKGLVVFDETGSAGDTFIGVMPSGPDAAVALTPSGGNPTNSHDGYDEPTLQVRVRGAASDPRVPYRRARRIYDELVGLHATHLDFGGDDEAYVVRTTAMQSDPASIGLDENDRPEFVVNFAFYVRALTAHRV